MKRLPTEESKRTDTRRTPRNERANSSPAVSGDVRSSQGGSEIEEVAELEAPISAVQLVLASSGALGIV
jgi:hypothetical protein